MKLETLNELIASLVGNSLVDRWWESPNRYWNGFTPRQIYERDEDGKQEVEKYILGYCFGR
jgi:hypothetical protein